MNGIDKRGITGGVKQLRRDLAELKEMVRLGVRLPATNKEYI